MNPENSEQRGVLNYMTANNEQTSEPLTAEMLVSAIQKLHDEDMEQARGDAHRAANLLEATPEHLRSHPFIVNLAYLIGNGHIFHPEDARRAREEWERLCREG